MERGLLYKAVLCLITLTLSNISSSAQCVPGNVGNGVENSGQFIVNWISQLVVNEDDLYTNTSDQPKYLDVAEFGFFARSLGNPITPFVALVRGDNDFLVMAIGQTRTASEYNTGENHFSFSNTPTQIIVPPGASIAPGFMEANPDGSGAVAVTTVTLDTNGDEVWFTGGPAATASGSVEVGRPVGVGQFSFTGLTWSYQFNITMCESNTDVYTGLAPNTAFHGVNTTNDGADINIGDGICADANGHCTLRAAIEESNASAGGDVIIFSATGAMQVDAPLPEVASAIIVDGYTGAGYQQGAPSVSVVSAGIDLMTFRGGDGVTVRGLNLSGTSIGGFDSFGLSFYTCSDVLVEDNIIRNRVRAIHANGVFDLTVQNNDLRDCGDESVDAAIFMRNIVSEDIPGGGMIIRNNQYGGVNATPQSLFQVHRCSNVVVSDGTIPGTNIEMNRQEAFLYPIRLAEVSGAQIIGVDFSYAGPAQGGVGIRSLKSTNVTLAGNTIHNRRKAIDVDGGSAVTIINNDMENSGFSSDQGTISISNFDVVNNSDLLVRDNTFGFANTQLASYLSFYNSSGINVSNAGSSAHIKMDGVLDIYYPIRINNCDNMSVTDLDFEYASSVYHESKAIWVRNGGNNLTISGNSFHGWAAAVHIETGFGVNFSCNAATRNRNGILIDNNSTFSSVSDNNFACNAVALQHRGSTPIVTSNNYWGDHTGSSSANGFGDHILGSIDVTSFNALQNTCAPEISASACGGEICDNGIDDDLDGLIDCADGSCAQSNACADENLNANRAVDFVLDNDVFSIYPNPTQGTFTLALFKPSQSFRIYDVLGATVKAGKLLNLTELQIDLNGHNNGAYMIELVSDQRIVVKRLIKY